VNGVSGASANFGDATGRDAGRPLEPSDESVKYQDQLKVMKSEIDALQIQAVEKGRPWYRQAAIIISVLAFMFSAGATLYSNQQAHRSEIVSARSELGQLIQRLYTLPMERAELQVAYAQDPTMADALETINLTEHSILAQQAADIIDRIPGNVSANEYYGVGWALHQVGDLERARNIYQRGIQIAVNPHIESTILQSYGELLFAQEEYGLGRQQMQAALDLYVDMPSEQRARMFARIELFWASIEKRYSHCREVQLHLSQAQNAADSMPPGLSRDSIMAQIQSAAAPGSACF
jgi:tetratricopeptide (TPR) repeat protein